MKTWSKHWRSSKRRSKQRKYYLQAPQHVRRKLVSAHLSDELKKKYGKRSAKLKVGDKVKIMRGEFKSVVGKVKKINLHTLKAEVDGVERKNTQGTKYAVKLDPSKLVILELNLDDAKRGEALKKK